MKSGNELKSLVSTALNRHALNPAFSQAEVRELQVVKESCKPKDMYPIDTHTLNLLLGELS